MQVRGYLSHYKNLLVVGHAYDKCTACSDTVIHAYQLYAALSACASPLT